MANDAHFGGAKRSEVTDLGRRAVNSRSCLLFQSSVRLGTAQAMRQSRRLQLDGLLPWPRCIAERSAQNACKCFSSRMRTRAEGSHGWTHRELRKDFVDRGRSSKSGLEPGLDLPAYDVGGGGVCNRSLVGEESRPARARQYNSGVAASNGASRICVLDDETMTIEFSDCDSSVRYAECKSDLPCTKDQQ